MPQRRAAKKDLRKNKKRHSKNLFRKQKVKSAIKKLKLSLKNEDKSLRQQALNELYKAFDRAAAKKVIHPNKAARKKSSYTKLVNTAKS